MENIPPSFVVSDITLDNVFTLMFSEFVTFTSFSDLESNLRTRINGPQINYQYSSGFTDAMQSLQPGVPFKFLKVKIYDVKATLKGGGFEKVKIWFDDNSVIKDLAENDLTNVFAYENLNFFEYVPQGK